MQAALRRDAADQARNAPSFREDAAMSRSKGRSASFWFTQDEIRAHAVDPGTWGRFVREREARMILGLYPGRFASALEIGAGSGVQSRILAQHCAQLTCTDISSEAVARARARPDMPPGIEWRVCDARDLAQFPTSGFDMIWSSHVLEHVRDLAACMHECRRLLKPGGVMLNSMPSRYWKAFHLLLSMAHGTLPETHGWSRDHLSEFRAFGRRRWVAELERPDLTVERVVGMPFYVGHGNRYERLLRAGNALGWPGAYLFALRRR